jgi:hypothetical protein
MKKTLWFFLTFSTLVSCIKVDNCDGILCFTPPQNFTFEMVDKISGENLYANKTLDTLDLVVLNEEGKNEKFNFISQNGLNLIDLPEIGWNTGLRQYQIILNDTLSVNIQVNTEVVNEGCCTFYRTKSFQVLNYEYHQNDSLGYYVVKID